jgi:hypothetical protein
MTINEYRKQWLRWHRIYERKAYYILLRGVLKSMSRIDVNVLTEDNYEGYIRTALDNSDVINAYSELYSTIGLQHGKRVLKDLERQQKDAFTDTFINKVIEFIFRYSGTRIKSVTDTLADYILDEIAKGKLNNKTISEIVTGLMKRRSFYRYQLLRIARTETTAAAGYASDVASSTSGLILEKVWISAQDSRTRVVPEDSYDHYHMNLVRVDDGQPFKVRKKGGGFELLRFPADPEASAGNVINCRCSIVKVGKRDSDGNLMYR